MRNYGNVEGSVSFIWKGVYLLCLFAFLTLSISSIYEACQEYLSPDQYYANWHGKANLVAGFIVLAISMTYFWLFIRWPNDRYSLLSYLLSCFLAGGSSYVVLESLGKGDASQDVMSRVSFCLIIGVPVAIITAMAIRWTFIRSSNRTR